MSRIDWRSIPPQTLEVFTRNSLTHRQQEAVFLAHRGGSRRQISSILGISQTSVRDRLRGAERRYLDHIAKRETVT